MYTLDTEYQPLFRDRIAAGVELARVLDRYHARHGVTPLVLGIPRGGVPVAAEVARRLDADLDVIVARKLGSPISPELAIGAVTASGVRYLDQAAIDELGVSAAYVERVAREQTAEARRRETLFHRMGARIAVLQRVVIVVDDGLATGSTMRAAVRAVRQGPPSWLVVAVPVGPPETCAELRLEADEVVCPHEIEGFLAVGAYYEHFEATEDSEVVQILRGWSEMRRQRRAETV